MRRRKYVIKAKVDNLQFFFIIIIIFNIVIILKSIEAIFMNLEYVNFFM